MNASMIVYGVVLLTVAAALVVVGRQPFVDVTRARLERFARRQRLVVTPANGQRVIAYLATTRRWRGGLLLLGLVVAGVVYGAQGRGVQVNAVAGFVGWFVGAVVAEWRVGGGARDGVRRAASLVPRRLRDYVPVSLIVLAGVALVGIAAFGVAVLVTTRGGLVGPLGCLAGLAVVAGVIAFVARRVLTRPQVLDRDLLDVVAADDALRSRSLHVLLGSGVAVAGYLLSLAGSIGSRDTDWAGVGAASALTAVGILAMPLLGLLAATAPFRPRTTRALVGTGAAGVAA